VSASPRQVTAEFLRWTLHELEAGDAVTIAWGVREEGLLQVLRGACDVEHIAGGDALHRDHALWITGEQSVVLRAPRPASCLDVRVSIDHDRRSAMSIRWPDLAPEKLNASLAGRSVAGEHLSAWRFDVAPGYYVDDLEHREEQLSAPLDGGFAMLTGGERRRLVPGDVAYVPTNLPHGGDFLDAGVTLLEVFCPKREGATTFQIESESR
jgi:quercetin dioxygenase-like cupin family protein